MTGDAPDPFLSPDEVRAWEGKVHPVYGLILVAPGADLGGGLGVPGVSDPAPCPDAIDLIRDMRACPHWVKRSDCGCGQNECKLGKGKKGIVAINDCITCLTERRNEALAKGE